MRVSIFRPRAAWQIVLTGITLTLTLSAYAEPSWLGDFNSTYGTGGTRLDTCGLCHRDFGDGSRNPYGTAFSNAGGDNNPAAAFAAIEGDFSDSDSTNNLDEIMLLFMPGISCSNLGQISNGPADLADYVDPALPGCVAADTDDDGIADDQDNCMLIANPDQRDVDGDNIGNLCDPDVAAPNDCIVNFLDLNVYRSNFFQAGDLDTDNNGDGQTNFLDLNIVRSSFFGPPGPSANGCN